MGGGCGGVRERGWGGAGGGGGGRFRVRTMRSADTCVFRDPYMGKRPK